MIHWRCHIRIAAVLAAVGLAAASQAASFEEVQRTKAQVVVPRWKAAALRSKELRAAPPDAATAQAWSALDAQTDPQIGKAPLDQVAAARDAAELLTNASWLRWRILSENADARYSFVYAAHLSRMRDTEGNFDQEAAIFLFHAKLALTLDGMRCTDRTKAEHLAAWYAKLSDLQPLLKKVERMPAADKSAAILEAIGLEEMLGERPPMGWLCPRRGPDNDVATPPRYLSDEAWRKYRAEQFEQLTREALQGL